VEPDDFFEGPGKGGTVLRKVVAEESSEAMKFVVWTAGEV